MCRCHSLEPDTVFGMGSCHFTFYSDRRNYTPWTSPFCSSCKMYCNPSLSFLFFLSCLLQNITGEQWRYLGVAGPTWHAFTLPPCQQALYFPQHTGSCITPNTSFEAQFTKQKRLQSIAALAVTANGTDVYCIIRKGLSSISQQNFQQFPLLTHHPLLGWRRENASHIPCAHSFPLINYS